MKVSTDSELNRQRATTLVAEAASNGAQVIALPECWNCPYSNGAFPKYAETCPEVPRAHDDDAGTRSADAVGESSLLLAALAKRHGVYLIGGSVPERATDSRIYNTCLMYGPDGVLLAKHRKMHLFDIDVPGKMTFRESDTLSAGNQITAVQTSTYSLSLVFFFFFFSFSLSLIKITFVVYLQLAQSMTQRPINRHRSKPIDRC